MNWLRPIPTLGLAMLVSLTLAACASGTPIASTASAASHGPATSTGPASSAPAASNGPTAGGGDLSKVDACALLTPGEIHDATGGEVQVGVNADSDIVKQCSWESADGGLALGIVVRTFTDDDWDTIKIFPNAEPVSGLVEAVEVV